MAAGAAARSPLDGSCGASVPRTRTRTPTLEARSAVAGTLRGDSLGGGGGGTCTVLGLQSHMCTAGDARTSLGPNVANTNRWSEWFGGVKAPFGGALPFCCRSGSVPLVPHAMHPRQVCAGAEGLWALEPVAGGGPGVPCHGCVQHCRVPMPVP